MAKESPPLEKRADLVREIALLLREVPPSDQAAILRSAAELLGLDTSGN